MRYYEIIAESRVRSALVDPETDLYMNSPNIWSQSPYLGAVKSLDGDSYMAQIHIPQGTWSRVIDHQSEKWQKTSLPSSFFSHKGNQRHTIRITGFQDPRRAAWLVQAILYDSTNDTDELIEDALEGKYIHGMKFNEVWSDLIAQIPQYDSTPLVDGDQEIWQELYREANPPKEPKKPKDTGISTAADRQVAAIIARQKIRGRLRDAGSTKKTYATRAEPKIKEGIIDYLRKRKKYRYKANGDGRSNVEFEHIADSIISGEGANVFLEPNTITLRAISDVMKDIDLSKYI